MKKILIALLLLAVCSLPLSALPSRTLKRSYSIAQLGVFPASATTGVWTEQLATGLFSLHKAAAATTSVVNIQIPHGPQGGIGGISTSPDTNVQLIELFYLVSTADLTSAPTVALNRVTLPGGLLGTGFAANTTVTQALTFAGVDTIGKISGVGLAGSHIAVVTITTPTVLADTDALILTITMGEAATSVLDIFGITVTYQ